MFWLEMSRDPTHGGGSWGFGLSLWSPAHKRGSAGKWPFWENLLRVNEGDPILHLRGIGNDAAFVGFSTALTSGSEASQKPPSPGQWEYAERYYFVPLRDYISFPQVIPLKDVLLREEAGLREYFLTNKSEPPSQKRRLFFVIQSGRLQCLNGAYLSEVDDQP